MVTKMIWKGYLEKGIMPDSVVDPKVLKSWFRCQEMGLKAVDKPATKLVSGKGLYEKKLASSSLLKACESVLACLADICRQNGCLVIVANDEGYILEIDGDQRLLVELQSSDICIGTNWQESIKGTNVIGTVIQTKSRIELVGFDHYYTVFHNWFWCGTPVLDYIGNLIGVISILSPKPERINWIPGMIDIAAQNINLHYILEQAPPSMLKVIREKDPQDKSGELELFSKVYKDNVPSDLISNLTRLYNHNLFNERLDEIINENTKKSLPISLVLVDIDHFKHFNEVVGRVAGDRVLTEMAELFRNIVRNRDFIARNGGDRFALVLSGAEPELAVIIANRLRAAVENYPFDGREVQPEGKVTISSGIATYPVNASNKEELMIKAEENLAQSQKKRNNKISLKFTDFSDLRQELNDKDLSRLNTIRTLVALVNAKDKYTYGHSERVVFYSTALAERLRLPREEIKFIRYGAYLHDIGKIQISRDILTKNEPLTPIEWKSLRGHPQWGVEIVKPVTSLTQIIPQILHHHERYDGKGYPHGIGGEEIPLAARILAIADCYDAMISDRPYKKMRTTTQAIRELLACSGTQFDPKLVPEFIEIIKEQFQSKTAKV